MSEFHQIIERARELRHDIHRHPELRYEEERTAGLVRAELDRLGIPWRACAGTGSVGVLAADAPGACVGLRADMDALPLQELNELPYKSTIDGKMHACGHDGHTASLLAAAHWLKAHEAQLPGPVRLVFQPAEEGGAGARAMIEDGGLEGIDVIFGYHNWPALPQGTAACCDGTLMAANGAFEITLIGKGGHASQPERCVDTILLGSQIVQAINTIIARQVAPQLASVISVTTFHGGTTDNIIPESVTFGGTIRAPITEERDALAERVRQLAEGLALASGARAEMRWRPYYPATVNHAEPAQRAREALISQAVIEQLDHAALPLMGSEDFSFFLEQIPGAYALIGAGRPGGQIEVCHSPRFDYNDELLPIALRYFAAVAGAPVPD